MVADGFHVRRVVVGPGADGEPVILSDETPPLTIDAPSGFGVSELLSSAGPLTSVEDGGDPPRDRVGAFPADGGVAARLIRFPVTGEWVRISGDDPDRPGMHRSETLDLMVVLSGRILLGVEDGEDEVGPGDSVIQRGTLHRWKVAGDGPCTYLSVLLAPCDGALVPAPPQTPLQAGTGPQIFVTGTGSQGSTIEFKGTTAPDDCGRRHWWTTAGPVRSVDQGGIGGSVQNDLPKPGAASLTIVDLDEHTPAFRTNRGSIDLVTVMAGTVAASLDADATQSASGSGSRPDQLSLSVGDVLIARDVALPLASTSARLALVSFVPTKT
jgi:hypothetical protein